MQQGPRAELVGRALAPQGGQDVELPWLQPLAGERGPARPVQVPGQPGHPAEHLQRLDVQVGPLRLPGGDQVVHLVARQLPGHRLVHGRSLSLDVES